MKKLLLGWIVLLAFANDLRATEVLKENAAIPEIEEYFTSEVERLSSLFGKYAEDAEGTKMIKEQIEKVMKMRSDFYKKLLELEKERFNLEMKKRNAEYVLANREAEIKGEKERELKILANNIALQEQKRKAASALREKEEAYRRALNEKEHRDQEALEAQKKANKEDSEGQKRKTKAEIKKAEQAKEAAIAQLRERLKKDLEKLRTQVEKDIEKVREEYRQKSERRRSEMYEKQKEKYDAAMEKINQNPDLKLKDKGRPPSYLIDKKGKIIGVNPMILPTSAHLSEGNSKDYPPAQHRSANDNLLLSGSVLVICLFLPFSIFLYIKKSGKKIKSAKRAPRSKGKKPSSL